MSLRALCWPFPCKISFDISFRLVQLYTVQVQMHVQVQVYTVQEQVQVQVYTVQLYRVPGVNSGGHRSLARVGYATEPLSYAWITKIFTSISTGLDE